MKSGWNVWAWRVGKWLIGAAVLLFIGRHFWRDLQQLDLRDIHLRPEWVLLSALCYLVGQSFSGWYWYFLLRACGEPVTGYAVQRGFFLGHLAKYVPGKALTVLVRMQAVRQAGARGTTAIATTFSEVLTTMASGGVVCAVVFAFRPPEHPDFTWRPEFSLVALAALCCVPLLPAVINALVARLTRNFPRFEGLRVPPLTFGHLAAGLALGAACWIWMGLSLWALMTAVLPEPPVLTLDLLADLAASTSLAYVGGFLFVAAPAGLGVREAVLQQLLKPYGPEGLLAAVVLLSRLTCVAAELALGLPLYLRLPRAARSSEHKLLPQPQQVGPLP